MRKHDVRLRPTKAKPDNNALVTAVIAFIEAVFAAPGGKFAQTRLDPTHNKTQMECILTFDLIRMLPMTAPSHPDSKISRPW